MQVQVINKKGAAIDLFVQGGRNTTAELVPHTVKNDNTNRKLQRDAFGKELPDLTSDPMLVYADGHWCLYSTAMKFGKVVNAETQEAIIINTTSPVTE
jgi:hypothetical protein